MLESTSAVVLQSTTVKGNSQGLHSSRFELRAGVWKFAGAGAGKYLQKVLQSTDVKFIRALQRRRCL